jgi:hypothetical protein
MDTEIKFIADEETGEVGAPRPIEPMERMMLMDWLPPKWVKDSEKSILDVSAYWRNVYRISEAYGPRLIAMMAAAGAIMPEQDPEQALRSVLKAAGF